MQIRLTRDGVASSDDADPDSLDVPSSSTLREILDAVVRADFLASIQGGKATWSVHLEKKTPVAVMAQEWDAPKFIASPDTRYGAERLHLYFHYHAQKPPDEIFAALGGRRPRSAG